MTEVSIHAPLRGATSDVVVWDFFINVSIHAPLRGATLAGVLMSAPRAFQSTHPCGVRLKPTGFVIVFSSFNPRTPAGCDITDVGILHIEWGFNPRTPAGCDPQF